MHALALATCALASLWTAAPAAPTVPAPSAGPRASVQIDHPSLARRYAERHGLEVQDASQIDLFPFLAEHHARVDIGAFRVNFPGTALEDKNQFELVQTVCYELVGAQLTWLEWLHQGENKRAISEFDLDDHGKRLQRWVKSWRHSTWRYDYEKGKRDFTPLPDEEEAVYLASSAFIDYVGRGEPLATGRTEPVLTPLYLIPTREDFVELLCLMGWVFSHLRHEYWAQDAWSWTQFYFEDAHFLALEFAAASDRDDTKVQGYSGDYTRSTPMKTFNDEGLEQQLVQLAFRGLVGNLFGDRISPAFSAGIASLLVIDIYGEVDTRTDGDMRGKKTQARSVFVPGGNSGGGTLPPNYADGRFRSPKNGADFFVPILRDVQRAGSKEVRNKQDKHRSFEILDDEEKEQWILQAPVLHFSTEKRVHPPDEEFTGDMLEFLRSYRICFVHWLRDSALGSKNKSRAAFARFLSALASPEGSLELALEEVYEQPLSDEEASKKSLEGSFLHWLAK